MSRHKWLRAILVACVILLALCSGAASALEVGVRVGTDVGARQSYDSQELYLRTALPYRLGEPGGWQVSTQLEGNVGRLSTRGESLSYGGAAVAFWLARPAAPVSFGVGTGPTYLSRSRLGTRDFGGPWQFTSHAVARLDLTQALSVAYRIQHTSNAGLYSSNDGINIQALEVRLRF